MIILDENFPNSQCQLLKGWRISFKQIAFGIGNEGMKDDAIIPLLHQLSQPTFFTLDADFFKPRLCHAKYCLVYVNVAQYEAATFVRRALSHEEFNTKAKRMGSVVGISHQGLSVWYLHAEEKVKFSWES